MGANGFWSGRQRLRCGGGRGVLGAGGCPTEYGRFWYQRADQKQGWATGAVSGASPTCEPRMSPRTWDTCSGVVAELGLGPHQCASIGTSWREDRMRNVRAEAGEPAQQGGVGLSCKEPSTWDSCCWQAGRAAGIQPPELWERPGVPGNGESCGVMARGRGGRKAQEASVRTFSARAGPVSPPSWT